MFGIVQRPGAYTNRIACDLNLGAKRLQRKLRGMHVATRIQIADLDRLWTLPAEDERAVRDRFVARNADASAQRARSERALRHHAKSTYTLQSRPLLQRMSLTEKSPEKIVSAMVLARRIFKMPV